MSLYSTATKVENPRRFLDTNFIHGDSDVLAAAGIYHVRNVDGEWEVSCSIITREARDASGQLHDRMPMFVSPDVFDRWLDPQKLVGDEIDATLLILTAESEWIAKTISTYEVDRKVNNSRTADPADESPIEPVGS